MVRKSSVVSSSHGRRKSSAPLPHVVESESEPDASANETLIAKAAQELHDMETLEAEREARFHEAERELQSVLETDDVSEHVRKRQLTRLFDRFRFEYTQLSLRFRENLRLQHKLMDKCLVMKNELVMTAIRIKTAKQLQDEEMTNLVFYRDECEHAWKATSVCEARERDAMRIIDELKSEIDDLQNQVKALLGMGTSTSQRGHGTVAKPRGSLDDARRSPSASTGSTEASLSPVRSPVKKGRPTAAMTSPTKDTGLPEPPHVLSFDEWKRSTRVWSPPMGGQTVGYKAPTPTQDELRFLERSREMARCVSVPTLQPTAMDRATTAVSLSPSRREQRQDASLLEARRATTSVSGKRAATNHNVTQLPPHLPRVTAVRRSPAM